MAKRKKTDPELPLFDLPLRPDGEEEIVSAEDANAADLSMDDGAPATPVQTTLPDVVVEPPTRERVEMTHTPTGGEGSLDVTVTPPAQPNEDPSGPSLFDDPHGEGIDDEMEFALAAPLGERALAGLADLGINFLMLALAALGCHFVGVRPSLDLWPPFVGLSLVLSFLYWIIPLAFWGQTPGMAWLGNIARSFDDEPLSFGQALLRWLGAWITAGLLGLPQLLALGGRSLSDRLSDSKTLVLPDEPDT